MARPADPAPAEMAAQTADRRLRQGGGRGDGGRAFRRRRRSTSPPRAMPRRWPTRLGGTLLPTGSVRLSGRARSRRCRASTRAMVGAGRRRRDPGAGARGPARRAGARPLRRAGRQDDAARRRRRRGDGRRHLAAADGPGLREPGPHRPRGRLRDRRRAAVTKAGRLTRSCSMRPAPRPARSAAIPTCRRPRTAAISPDCSSCRQHLIDRALGMLKPGGRLVYCTCSLLIDEGEEQVRDALARHPGLAVDRDGAGPAGDRAGLDRARGRAAAAPRLLGRHAAAWTASTSPACDQPG